jgi:phage terminase large subunit-like protein
MKKPDEIPDEMRSLLQLIPGGYDPLATAGAALFDPEDAERPVRFIEQRLVHVEGALAGKPFLLQPWQKAWVMNLFGWKVKRGSHWVRRYQETLLYVPRKNGKSPLAAAVALYVFFLDPEIGQQDYIAAGEREQAGMLFRHCRGMIERQPSLARRCRIYGGNATAGQSKSIVKEEEGSFLRCISADAETKHGGNTHLAILDELHVQNDRDLVDVLKTSMASANRRQPLLIYLTTADYMRESICNEVYDYACKVRDHVIEDVSFLPVIYEATKDEPWDSEDIWRRTNPNLEVSVSLDYLRRECARAKETPAYENTFRRLHLNQRTESDVRAISLDTWDKSAGEVIPADLEGRGCFGGLDLSTTTDLSALVLVFPDVDGTYKVLPHFWAPAEGAKKRERKDRVPYELWARQGYLTLTPGNVIDYDRIRADINEMMERYHIRELAADRWNATQIIQQLMGDGLEVIAFGQGFKDMTAPTKELIKLAVEGKLQHGGHPLLRWCAGNLMCEQDAAGNLKPSKKKSSERIDGVVALIMALGRAMLEETAEPEITWI